MFQRGLLAVLWSHIGILMCLFAAEPRSIARLLFLFRYLCGAILLRLCSMVWDWRVSRIEACIFIGLAARFLFVFYCFPFLLFLYIGCCCGARVFGLIGCTFSPSIAMPTCLIIMITIIIIIQHFCSWFSRYFGALNALRIMLFIITNPIVN